jgi:hypothetical protein
MYALHEITCVYEVQVKSFFRDLYKCYILVHYFYKWHAYMYKGSINDNFKNKNKIMWYLCVCL